MCDSCYSDCPVYAVNPEFLGPFALTRAYRYTTDKREGNVKAIDLKMDITMLRGTSLQQGYNDPTFTQQSFGTPNFGFDPNGGF